jgi:hypothetical protein
MTKLALVSLLVLAACTKNPDATTPGTTVIAWQLADSDRSSIRAAKLTDVKTQTFTHDAHPTKDTTVKVEVTLETATVTFEEDGKQVVHRAPTKLAVKAIDAGGFTLSKSKGGCMGPHYDMNLPPSLDMILHCTISAKKPRYDVGFWLYAYGDNRIDDGNPKTIKVH